jgi:ubiquinone/menaquinone biosynthesis C-methylase UbiE
MGLYSKYIVPWIIDHVMDRQVMAGQRQTVLADAYGRVLEIGFGTGLNLPHYPSRVEHLTILDPNVGMHRRAAGRIAVSRLTIDPLNLSADADLPTNDCVFDTVVSTWTMCCIPDLPRALTEVARVLKPGGQLLFVEHGLSQDPKVARWQQRLNPLNMRLGDGCHLNRDIAYFVRGSGLTISQCDQFYLPRTPRISGWTFRGRALKQPN